MKPPEIPGYRLVGEQGQGTFGVVYHGTWQARLDCAVKVFHRDSIHQQYVSWCLERLLVPERHPNLIQIYGFDLTSETPYVSMQWAGTSGNVETLEAFSGKWTALQASQALRAMAEALSWLHRQSVIHTGLTARNVFIMNGIPSSVLISDVGQGWLSSEQTADWRTHVPYFGPERLHGEAPTGESSGEAWDVYAFGVTAFQLLTGRYPRANELFRKMENRKNRTDHLNFNHLAKQIERETQLNWGGRAGSAEELALRRIVERCLTLDQNNRHPHMSDVLAELEKTVPSSAPSLQEPPTPYSARSPISTAATPTTPAEPQPLPAPSKARSRQKSKLAETPTVPPAAAPRAEAPKPEKALLAQPKAPRAPLFNFPKPKFPAAGGWLTWGLALAASAAGMVAMIALAGKSSQKSRADDLETQLASATAAQSAADKAAADLRVEMKATTAAAEQAVARQKQDHSNLVVREGLTQKLVEALLNQRPREPAALEQWKQVLAEFGTQGTAFLEKFGKDPELRPTAVRTRWHLASVFTTLGDNARAAGLLEEAVREVDAAAAAATGKEEQAEWSLLLGRIQSLRGKLALEEGKSAEAAPTLGQASKSLQSWLALHPEDHAVQREAATASQFEALALEGKGDAAAALEPANRAAEAALKLALSPQGRDEDIWLLADARFAAGRSLVAQKKDKEALASFMDPLEKLIDFDRDHPKSEPCRERMAIAFSESGQILNRQGSPKDAAQAFNQGIKVLLELVTERPDNERYNFEIGRAYGAVARLVKAERSPAEALSYAKSAVSFLKLLTDKNRVEPAYRLHLGRELAGLAEVQEDLQQFSDGLKSAQHAATLLGDLLNENLSSELRTQALYALAMSQTSLGHCSEKTNNREDTISHYEDAVQTWEKVIAAGENDARATKSLNWAREQLKRLKP